MQSFYGSMFSKNDIVEFIDGTIRKVLLMDDEFAVMVLYEQKVDENSEQYYHEDFEDVAIYPNNPFFEHSVMVHVAAVNGTQVVK